jgi:hypothetical protein
MAVSNDYIDKLSNLKLEDAKDAEPKMFRLKNLMVWESTITDAQKELAAKAEINLYSLEEIILKGR